MTREPMHAHGKNFSESKKVLVAISQGGGVTSQGVFRSFFADLTYKFFQGCTLDSRRKLQSPSRETEAGFPYRSRFFHIIPPLSVSALFVSCKHIAI